MKRRTFIKNIGALFALDNPFTFIKAFTMSKTNIRKFGKTFDYLQNPDLRTKEIGEQLMRVNNADISGASFQKIVWRNIEFVNCDFQSGYDIKLSELDNCRFIDCQFQGIINWGAATNTRFVRCKFYGESNIIGSSGTKNLVHEQCEFINPKGGRNHLGAIGAYGEVEFIKCKAEFFDFLGTIQLKLSDCQLKDCTISTDSEANTGPHFKRAEIVINQCMLIGLTNMINADLTNLTILNTQYESIDLTNATFTGDFYMEQCQGGNTDALIKDGPYRITIKNCRFLPNNKEKFVFFMSGSAKEVVIDNLKIVHTDKEIEMQFGAKGGKSIVDGVEKIYPPDLAKKITLSNTSIPQFNFEYSAADYMLIKNCEFDRANFRKSRYKKLEIINTRISRQIDFTDTKVDEQNIEFIAGFKNRIELTDGSNVRLPR